MKIFSRLILVVSLALSSTVVNASFFVDAAQAKENLPPKNIILFIGDGMGIAQITAGKIAQGQLNLEQFKHIGLLMTHSQSALISDSAAAGTAIATGHKTFNKAVSVSITGKPLKTVMEYAQDADKATGIVVTSSVTHATPAVFMAHVDSRNKQALIARQIATSRMDVLFGGGWGYFVPGTVDGSFRNDQLDLLAEFPLVIRTAEEFNQIDDKITSVLGLFAKKALPKAIKRKPSLAQMAQKAIAILSKNKQGFVLMVEGSQIDWAGHANKADYLISEMIDFDEAIGVGLNFAKTQPQTLVLVLADHETGGFAIHNGSVANKVVSETSFTRKYHTAEMVPVFAYGRHATDFTGIYDNTKIGQLLIQYLR